MGYSRFLFAGIYLKIQKINIKSSTEVEGCPTCKTTDRNKFCGKCGHEIVTYDKPVKIDSIEGLLSHVIDDDSIDELYDKFVLRYDCVIPNGGELGESFDLDGEFDYEFEDQSFDEAEMFYKPITDVLDEHGVKYNLTNGICYLLL